MQLSTPATNTICDMRGQRSWWIVELCDRELVKIFSSWLGLWYLYSQL